MVIACGPRQAESVGAFNRPTTSPRFRLTGTGDPQLWPPADAGIKAPKLLLICSTGSTVWAISSATAPPPLKDLTRAAFYHPDVTIYEGGSVNTGWADYRNHHLGLELEQLRKTRERLLV